MPSSILDDRRASISAGEIAKDSGTQPGRTMRCGTQSVSGSVSQRACVYCGARVVLNPVTDAFHLVHGPIGCAAYTRDIRGSLSSGSELYRNSFSTDLDERDIVFGGTEKLSRAVDEIVANYHPPLIFIYSTCIVGVIGDDVEAVCRKAEAKHSIRVINVQAPGFAGNKSVGYRLAGEALMKLISPHYTGRKVKAVNILGDYNLAGEIWIIKNYFQQIGIDVLSVFTGDSSYQTLIKAPSASLNIVQCAGSMVNLAAKMEESFGIPWVTASFFGTDDTSSALLRAAELMGDEKARNKAKILVTAEKAKTEAALTEYLPGLKGKKAAVFVGGGFKAVSLVRQFNALGMETVLVGTQTGSAEDYEVLGGLVGPKAVILDDANPAELEAFMESRGADILVGGVKERPLAYKMGIAFCDHNHERRHPLAGFVGVENFTREIHRSINSPVWAQARAQCPF
ncbi:MAG: nitrogenase iron-molybdenum cofactor biosynthesis protein NifE [Deltaproteobacteria bacterium]|jgi:nitrogenase molybdenum-cofactor synthesis protein NifE|nr:nitrogenase iron-molybdenum cofactor biosynthesis protein NifE [Deltaproteobacteria bacterium]